MDMVREKFTIIGPFYPCCYLNTDQNVRGAINCATTNVSIITQEPSRSPSNQNRAEGTPLWLYIVRMWQLFQKNQYPHVQPVRNAHSLPHVAQPSPAQMGSECV